MNANAQAFVPTSTGTPSPTSDAKLSASLRDNSSNISNNNKKSRLPKQQQQRHSNYHSSSKQQNQPSRQQQQQRNHSSSHTRQQRSQNSRKSNATTVTAAAESTRQEQEEHAIDKKGRVSLNHLLNFSFPERRAPTSTYTPRRSNKQSSSSSPYNKERFVNANFRFLVNPSDDYTFHLADPDSRFDWSAIEQVLISASGEVPSCPICLSPPTAARVTKCGHIFCLPCILHYLELRENPKKQWRKCPICWDPVYERDFKPVQILHTFAVAEREQQRKSTAIIEGDKVDMALVMRTSGSTLALPVSASWPVPDAVVDTYLKPGAPVIPWHFTPNAMQFARFMLAGPEYLLAEYGRDRQGLMDAMTEAEEWNLAEEIPFIERATAQVDEKIAQFKRQNTKQVELAMHTAQMLFDTAAAINTGELAKNKKVETMQVAAQQDGYDNLEEEKKEQEEIPLSYQQYHSQRAGQDTEASSVSEQQSPDAQINLAKPKMGPTLDYHFYQASDGQHVYLHPLDIRILKHEYGGFERFPDQLQVSVEGVEETTMTEEVRKRFKYLNHLPLSCDVTFLEVDLKKLVSNDTSKAFSNELKMRAKKRQDRIRREEKGRKAIEARQKIEQRSRDEANRRVIQSDPFFFHNPDANQENEAMLARAISESAREQHEQQSQQQGPKTVWGTRAVAAQEEAEAGSSDWADHIVVTTKKKKSKQKHKK